MIEVWYINEDGYWTGKRDTVFIVEEGMTDVKMLVGYVKPKLVNGEWIEGATEEEIQEWKDNKIDNCSPKTTEQKLEETNQMLTQIIINQL